MFMCLCELSFTKCAHNKIFQTMGKQKDNTQSLTIKKKKYM